MHSLPLSRFPTAAPDGAAARRRAIAVLPLVLILVLALSGCSIFGGGKKKGGSALRPLPSFEPLVSIDTLWSTDAGAGIGRKWLVLAPATSTTTRLVHVAHEDGRVTTYDIASGDSAWRADVDTDISGGAGAGHGLVAVGTDEGEVIALAADTGEIAWRARVSSEVLSRPRPAQELVIVRALDGKLIGLDAETGAERWSHDGGAPGLSVRGTSPPALTDNIAVSGFDNGSLVAVRSGTGELLWEAVISSPLGRSELDRLADIDSAPVIMGDAVYAATYERELAAFDMASGRELWRRAIASRSGLAADADLVFVADTNGVVHALDRLSGETVWTQDHLLGRNPTHPTVHGAFVMFADGQGRLHWLRREDGQPAARARFGDDRLAGPPVRYRNTLIVYGARGRLTAYGFRAPR